MHRLDIQVSCAQSLSLENCFILDMIPYKLFSLAGPIAHNFWVSTFQILTKSLVETIHGKILCSNILETFPSCPHLQPTRLELHIFVTFHKNIMIREGK